MSLERRVGRKPMRGATDNTMEGEVLSMLRLDYDAGSRICGGGSTSVRTGFRFTTPFV